MIKVPQKKIYSSSVDYDKKLRTVMAKLGVTEFNYDYGRFSTFIQFTYQGQSYRFEHDADKAKANGQKIYYGSDCFAQLVLTLEDLARMTQRGTYNFASFISGMKYLPAASSIPECLLKLGFDAIPSGTEEVKTRYRNLAKAAHPDAGGDAGHFNSLNDAYEQAIKYFEEEKT
jgi:hypothetical protein